MVHPFALIYQPLPQASLHQRWKRGRTPSLVENEWTSGVPGHKSGGLCSSLTAPQTTLCFFPIREWQGEAQVRATSQTAHAAPSSVSACSLQVWEGLGFQKQHWQGQRTVQSNTTCAGSGTRLPALASRSLTCLGSSKEANSSATSQLTWAILVWRTNNIFSSQPWNSKFNFKLHCQEIPS